MFTRSGEDQKWFLFRCNFDVIVIWGLKVVYLCFSKDKTFVFDSSLLKSDSSGHIFDMLHDKINRNPVISETRNNDICIDNWRQNEISESIFDKLVILLKHAYYWPSSFSCISFQSSTQSDIIWLDQWLPSQLMKILYVSKSLILLS